MRAAIASDDTLTEVATSEDADPSLYEFDWREDPRSPPVAFTLYAGEISVTTPSGAALRKLQEIAVRLGADVFGEEGENLINTEADPPSSAGLAGCAVIVILVAASIWWVLAQ
jgi:hypothetical protein